MVGGNSKEETLLEQGQAAIVGLPIKDGKLVHPSNKQASPRILLLRSSSTFTPTMESEKKDEAGSSNSSSTVTVTWNGDKIRTGSSHRCAETRDTAVAPERKQALDQALVELGRVGGWVGGWVEY